MPQFKKHNVSKHERDRQDRLQWRLFLEELISEIAEEQSRSLAPVDSVRHVQYTSLGNGSYWKVSLRGAE